MEDFLTSEKINEIIKTLKNTRGEREVRFDTESEEDMLSDDERALLQEISNKMGEKIYASNHWVPLELRIFTFQDVYEDYLSYFESCMDEDDEYGTMSFSDYVYDYFTVFEPYD